MSGDSVQRLGGIGEAISLLHDPSGQSGAQLRALLDAALARHGDVKVRMVVPGSSRDTGRGRSNVARGFSSAPLRVGKGRDGGREGGGGATPIASAAPSARNFGRRVGMSQGAAKALLNRSKGKAGRGGTTGHPVAYKRDRSPHSAEDKPALRARRRSRSPALTKSAVEAEGVPEGEGLVGRGVRVRWDESDGKHVWYCGEVIAYDEEAKVHVVRYEDGASKEHNLSDTKWELLDEDETDLGATASKNEGAEKVNSDSEDFGDFGDDSSSDEGSTQHAVVADSD